MFTPTKNYQSIPDEVTPLNGSEQENQQSSSPMSQARSKQTLFAAGLCAGMVLFLGGGALLPESMSAQLLPTSSSRNLEANTIKICVKEYVLVKKQASEEAFVKCYDKDPNGDDIMAEGLTGSDGCTTLTYKNQSWDSWGGRSPDIYCTVNKIGYVQAVPEDIEHHNQSEVADFGTVNLYRDRSFDYGHDNGCGPALFPNLVNDFFAWALRFREQCTHHDKCYWDCKIFIASGNDAEKAQKFCDDEMFEGMKSFCYANRGNLPGPGESACIKRADVVYATLQGTLTGSFAYDKTKDNCPTKDGKPAPSMSNDYTHAAECFPDGYGCGYDGSTNDDLSKCNKCCSGAGNYAIHSGNVWSDYYCKCFPRDLKCGSTLIGNRFNKCNQCCHGTRADKGLTFTDHYCI